MTIRAILACDQDWGIGKDGDLPWPKNSEDLKWFKKTTSGDVVIMGRNTWDSLPFKPLPNRTNVIVTSQDVEGAPECVVVDMRSFLKILPQIKFENKDIWVIGGAQLVDGLLSIIDEIHLSQIHGSYDCDTFLPRTLIEEQFTLTDSGIRDEVYVDVWSKR